MVCSAFVTKSFKVGFIRISSTAEDSNKWMTIQLNDWKIQNALTYFGTLSYMLHF